MVVKNGNIRLWLNKGKRKQKNSDLLRSKYYLLQLQRIPQLITSTCQTQKRNLWLAFCKECLQHESCLKCQHTFISTWTWEIAYCVKNWGYSFVVINELFNVNFFLNKVKFEPQNFQETLKFIWTLYLLMSRIFFIVTGYLVWPKTWCWLISRIWTLLE